MTPLGDQAVAMSAGDMALMLERARENGGLDRWARLALLWMDQASAEIARLRQVIIAIAPTTSTTNRYEPRR